MCVCRLSLRSYTLNPLHFLHLRTYLPIVDDTMFVCDYVYMTVQVQQWRAEERLPSSVARRLAHQRLRRLHVSKPTRM